MVKRPKNGKLYWVFSNDLGLGEPWPATYTKDKSPWNPKKYNHMVIDSNGAGTFIEFSWLFETKDEAYQAYYVEKINYAKEQVRKLAIEWTQFEDELAKISIKIQNNKKRKR